ncbi:MAG: zf-HC2 domain-containing protein [Sorangiineae bacterium]|nr:zf-HC2 domain-containing protein [Polyangiaceae bacterium]MEB2323979.1 zf-HC2 domain-containing protein [Sorangiineae bacterium]
MSHCRRFLAHTETFVDGELPAEKILEVEEHLTECAECAERVRLEEALRVSTRRAVLDAAPPTEALELRIRAALAAERGRERADHALDDRGRVLPWRTIVPVAAAAASVLVWAASVNGPSHAARASSGDTMNMSSSTTSVEQLIDEFVSFHADDPAPEVTEPSQVMRFEPAVGVPMRLPSLQQYGARWVGGNLVPVRNQRAASLRYQVDGHRVTVYVYNSTRFPLRVTLEPRVVQNRPVYVGNRRGYSIAAVEQRGVGYAVASDLNDSESAELVASIR